MNDLRCLVAAEWESFAVVEGACGAGPWGHSYRRRKRAATGEQLLGGGAGVEVAESAEVVEFVWPYWGVVGVHQYIASPLVGHFWQCKDVVPVAVGEHDCAHFEIACSVNDS